MTSSEIRSLQRGLNAFTRRYTDGIGSILVDGQMGPATRARIRTVKYLLGYLGPINSKADHNFRSRLWHPKTVRYSSRSRVARGMRRRVAQRRNARRNARAARKHSGVGRFDGLPVANEAVAILQWCRDHGWRGRLVSGYRTPAYSESLCFQMCGRPSCPGRCAGRSTNHAHAEPGRWAVDVSDYATFRRVVASCPLKPRAFNALPNDLVHFSPSGH